MALSPFAIDPSRLLEPAMLCSSPDQPVLPPLPSPMPGPGSWVLALHSMCNPGVRDAGAHFRALVVSPASFTPRGFTWSVQKPPFWSLHALTQCQSYNSCSKKEGIND